MYGEALVNCDLLAGYPPDQVYPAFVTALKAWARANRGLLRAESGRLEQAEEDLRQALDLVDRLKPSDQQMAVVFVLHDRALVRSALGNVLWAEGHHQEASDLFRAAEKEWRQAKSTPVRDNELAWFLATCPDTQFRNAKDAVDLAKQAVKGIPEGEPWRVLGVVDRSAWGCRQTLGVALFRAGDWKGAAEALVKAAALRGRDGRGRDGVTADNYDWFFMAMINWQLGDKKSARRTYDEAVQWMDAHRPNDIKLHCFREEAAQLLGIEPKKD